MRFDLPEARTLVYEMLIPIRWGDMDAMQHVNNASYFRYFETVRLEWMHSIGAAGDPAREGPAMVNAFCNFIKQLTFPGQVLARHFVAGVGRTSFDTYMTLERADEPGVVYANGGATLVWVDYKAQKSAPLPDALRAVLAPREPPARAPSG
ncbi:MAG: acyl-CoA thioesterase [Pseudomonadota bacterium]|nr:acyl-CoA thioesterase [Pseudomonadota bacterium]